MGRLVSCLAANPDKIYKLLGGFLKYDTFLADLVRVSKEYNKFRFSANPEE